MLAVSDEDKKIACKNYREDILNTEFALDRNCLSQANGVSEIHLLINKFMVRRVPSGLVSEMIQSAGDAEIDLATELINQIFVGVMSTKLEHYPGL